MTKFKKLIFAIIIILIAACTQQQQDQLCPPSVNRKFGFGVQNIYIIKHEDPAIQGNSDEPYIMNIGFRSTLGRHCSSVTQNMSSLPCWSSVNWSSSGDGITVPIPDAMGSMWFDSCWATNASDIPTILNIIQKDGLQVMGNVVVVLEQDNWPQSLRNQIQNALNDAIRIVLQEVVETGGQINNAQDLTTRLLDVTSQINVRAFRALRILMDASFDTDDDLIGVRLNLIFNLPNNWMDLLGITDQQFKASINVGEALQSAVSNRGQYIQNQIKNSQGKIDFVMAIRGIGFGLPSGGSTEPITTIFNMYDQNDVC